MTAAARTCHSSSCKVTDRRTFSNTSFEVGANWKPSADVLLYASMREGYRSGAVNAQAFSDPSEITFAPPETARTYEIGFKSTLLDRALTINGSLFQTDYSNQQVVVTEAPFAGGASGGSSSTASG